MEQARKKDKVNCEAREGALGYFRNKIHICKKEAQETKHWLRMLSTAVPVKADKARKLWKEAQELSMILGKIAVSCK